MKTLKRALPILLLVVLACITFALVGCGQTNSDNTDDTNNGNTTPDTPTETVVEITSFENAAIDNNKIFMFVENNIDSVTLSDKVQVSQNCTWKLYSDKLGRYEIPTKVAASSSGELLDGNNEFYILISSITEEKTNFYELTIHRSYEVDINYWFNDEIYKTEKVYTGHISTLANLDIEHYRLNYWQNSSNEKVENPTLWESLDLYANATYLRKTITLEMNLENCGEISGDGDYYEGDEITLTATPYLGYDFVGWYDDKNIISAALNAKFSMPDSDKTYVAKFKVKDEMKNFEFSSYDNFCIIMELKDKTVSEIIIPDYVNNVGQGIFNGCSNLKRITIPNISYRMASYFGSTEYENSTEIKYESGWSYVYYYIPNELEYIEIKKGNIPNSAFAEFSMVKTIVLPTDTTAIGSGAFSNCSNLENINLPNTITQIKDSTFTKCAKITKLNLNENINYIGNYAFSGCENLAKIDIPKSATYIGYYAFQDCKTITELTFSEKLEYVGYAVFKGCENLKSLTLENTKNWVYYRLEAGSFTTKLTISEQTLSNPTKAASFFITVGNYTTTKYFCVET